LARRGADHARGGPGERQRGPRSACAQHSVIREGRPAEEIHSLIEEDQDIAILVLAAGNAKEGPGPLVASIAGKSAAFPIPVTVVPLNLTDEDIESLA
jgi:nucleotide-binding universal stress UspA family protein